MWVGSDRLYHEWACLWLDKPSRSDLQALDKPVLLFKGTNTTRSMSHVCDVVQQALPHCIYVELDGAGHMSPFTHTEAVLPFVKQQLEMSEIQNT
jgi:pimeloyl-ACP methyl ester carboxylesterase